jgi:hypothetical protein
MSCFSCSPTKRVADSTEYDFVVLLFSAECSMMADVFGLSRQDGLAGASILQVIHPTCMLERSHISDNVLVALLNTRFGSAAVDC